MAKRAVCVSCFDFYDHRVELVMDQLREMGYACTYITGDYDHFKRQPHTISMPDGEMVHAPAYRRNISFARIRSHRVFARNVFRRVEELQPELIYSMVPPNSLARAAAQYKKKHPDVRIVLDLYDLWPETFPSNRVKQLAAPLFALWGRERDIGLAAADRIYTECDLFRQVLRRQLEGKDVRTLPICREGLTLQGEPRAPEGETLALCYLGSINALIDIEAIAALLRELTGLRPVTLHIIGEGDTREAFVQAAQTAGAQVEYHGRIYDPAARQAIFDQCHFGINVMKSSVCVGLTMKSLDYFAAGLPILNTIEGDTRALIGEYGAGIELNREDPGETARALAAVTTEQNAAMRRGTVRMFTEHFSVAAVRDILKDLK